MLPVLCCETYSLHSLFRDKTLTLEEIPALFRDLEIPGIAWNDLYFTSWDQAYLASLKQAAAKAGRHSLCLIMEGNLATPDEEARRRQIEENRMKLRAARELGAPVVRMNLGKAESEEADATVGIERCAAAFRELVPLARQLGVKITIENHGGPSTKADWILAIISGSDPEWIGSCLDFGNWPAEPVELRYEEITKLAPHAFHTHVKTHSFLPDGEEERVDYPRCFEIMKKTGYRGAVSIEWEGREPADPVEGVRLSRDLILRHWPEAGGQQG